jgi:hypothetical protein
MSGVIAEANEFILKGDIFEYGVKYGLSELVENVCR